MHTQQIAYFKLHHEMYKETSIGVGKGSKVHKIKFPYIYIQSLALILIVDKIL